MPTTILDYTPGTYTFTVPGYSTMKVELWGAGGQGGDSFGGNHSGTTPANCTFGSYLTGCQSGRGGIGGTAGAGTGGVASGGDVNTNGGAAWNVANDQANDRGGNCLGPSGGAGGAYNPAPGGHAGAAYGGGGSGAYAIQCGGGGGAYVKKTYSPGDIPVGSSVTLTIPSCTSSGSIGGLGGAGHMTITYDPLNINSINLPFMFN